MSWKQDLLGEINRAISQRKNVTFAVHSFEQKEWGEFIVEEIFSTLHLSKPLKLDFKVIPVTDQNRVHIGDRLDEKARYRC